MAQRLAAVAIEQQDMAQRLAFQAEHDALTGLPNRHLLEDRLQQALAYARRQKTQLGLLFLDLDGFKNINDTLGHNAGDVVLREVAQRLKNCVRESDTVARLGGDEFTVVLSDISSTQGVQVVAEKIIATLQAPFHVFDHEMHISASIGIAIFPDDAEETGLLLRNADAAMYRAKARGKGRFEFYSEEMGREREEKLRLKTRLREAFANNEFELFYQPQIDVSSERVVGLEALIRWKHPIMGTMPPINFIPAAEENGLILQIGEWVIHHACREVQTLQQQIQHAANRVLNEPLRISVNISAIQLGHSEFVGVVKRALEETGINPSSLVLEITEAAIMRNVDEIARQMEKLHALGVGLAIDDFGTGYSSLSYLQKLPLKELKIDRLSVRGLDNDVSARAFVAAITALGHNFGLQVVAEGIETREELDAAAQLCCDIAQGYFIARPLQLEPLTQWLQERAKNSDAN
jgi:diguanylate cyclase (GGDEF)-like protein